jgi:hypothetical protein
MAVAIRVVQTSRYSNRPILKRIHQDTASSMLRGMMYESCPESKDTSRVGRQGNLLCLLWQ